MNVDSKGNPFRRGQHGQQVGYAAVFTTMTLAQCWWARSSSCRCRGRSAGFKLPQPQEDGDYWPQAPLGKVILVPEGEVVATTPEGRLIAPGAPGAAQSDPGPLPPMGAPRAGQPAQP